MSCGVGADNPQIRMPSNVAQYHKLLARNHKVVVRIECYCLAAVVKTGQWIVGGPW
jgi:hypothetical protein